MKITKSKEFTVNMGNYESMKFGASIDIDSDEVEESPGQDPVVAGTEIAEKYLMKALKEDIRKASELTGVGTSYIHTIDADINA